MRTIFIILVLIFCGMNISAQKKMNGIGGEISALSIRPGYNMWFSKTTGVNLFAGVAAELTDFKPNDLEGGIRYLHAFQYSRSSRTYFGGMGKWKIAKPDIYDITVQLPVFGALIGKEWYNKKTYWKGFSAELGYQFGSKKYHIVNPVNKLDIATKTFEEFPLILNLKYSFYKR